VIGRHGDADVNDNGRLLLQLCCNNTLFIMNTFFFERRDVHKYIWCRDSLGQRSPIDFCIVSADLFRSVLEIRVKRCARLSTDRHLLACNCVWKNCRASTNV